MATRAYTALPLAAILVATAAGDARAAESYAGCVGFITTLPAVIAGEGVWCLTKDLSTAQASGPAIDIQAHNVTIDCNGFKLGGLGAGTATQAVGIRAHFRFNTGVRRCGIRGFHTGVELNGELVGGMVVENNRFDANTARAVVIVGGNGTRVRNNQVLATGGSSVAGTASVIGIEGTGAMLIVDNQVHGVTGSTTATSTAIGIRLQPGTGGRVAGNTVTGVFRQAPGSAIGIEFHGPGNGGVILDNALAADSAADIVAIQCASAGHAARGNTSHGHNFGVQGCNTDASNIHQY